MKGEAIILTFVDFVRTRWGVCWSRLCSAGNSIGAQLFLTVIVCSIIIVTTLWAWPCNYFLASMLSYSLIFPLLSSPQYYRVKKKNPFPLPARSCLFLSPCLHACCCGGVEECWGSTAVFFLFSSSGTAGDVTTRVGYFSICKSTVYFSTNSIEPRPPSLK